MIVSYQTSRGCLHKDGPIRGRREGGGGGGGLITGILR